MATKQQVINKAAKLGATLKVTRYEATLAAPEGFVLASGLNYSTWERGENTLAEIWADFISELNGLKAE